MLDMTSPKNTPNLLQKDGKNFLTIISLNELNTSLKRQSVKIDQKRDSKLCWLYKHI